MGAASGPSIPGAAKYKTCLYIVNGVIGVIAAVLLGIAIWVDKADAGVVVRESYPFLLWLFMVGAALALFLAFLGIYGAYYAERRIEQNELNCALVIYLIALFLVCIIEIIAAAVVSVMSGMVKDPTAVETSDDLQNKVETELRSWMRSNPSEWVNIQDKFDCCGYTNLTADWDLKTGVICNSTLDSDGNVVQPCRVVLFNKAEDMIVYLAAFGSVIAVIEIAALVSAGCLLWGFSAAKTKETVIRVQPSKSH